MLKRRHVKGMKRSEYLQRLTNPIDLANAADESEYTLNNDRVARGFSVATITPVEYNRPADYGTESPFALMEWAFGALASPSGKVARAYPGRFCSVGKRPPKRKQTMST